MPLAVFASNGIDARVLISTVVRGVFRYRVGEGTGLHTIGREENRGLVRELLPYTDSVTEEGREQGGLEVRRLLPRGRCSLRRPAVSLITYWSCWLPGGGDTPT